MEVQQTVARTVAGYGRKLARNMVFRSSYAFPRRVRARNVSRNGKSTDEFRRDDRRRRRRTRTTKILFSSLLIDGPSPAFGYFQARSLSLSRSLSARPLSEIKTEKYGARLFNHHCPLLLPSSRLFLPFVENILLLLFLSKEEVGFRTS